MRFPWYGAALVATLASLATPVLAIQAGQVDTFEDGTVDGWASGAANPNPPVLVASGGPGGAGDHYLLLRANGNAGAGGKLVGFGGDQWNGNYLAANVTSIGMDVANFGTTTISLRLSFVGPGATATSGAAVQVLAGSGWTHVSFDLTPGALAGQPLAALSGVTELRLFHSASADFPGP